MSAHDLLFEIRTEELPPRTLLGLSKALTDGVRLALDNAGIPHGKSQGFATPRRLAVRIQKLAEHQPDRQVERRGPPLERSFDAQGAPTQAAVAFAKNCGVPVSQLEQLKTAFKAAGKKLDMGKCCVHFESPDDLPLEAIGKLISAISSEKWIEMYEQSRLMTKAGQAQMAKQGSPSASKVAAKRVDTKRRR